MNVHASLQIGHSFADDEAVMRHALQIAQQGFGYVEPNPAVGAVIVDNDLRLIATGYHERFGGAHAEVNAITAARGKTHGQQIFVTLEPCSHTGKTPPCADAVVAAGFHRVVVGCTDPAPHVSGQGIETLQNAGINVKIGACQSEAEELIAPFRKLQLKGRPWVHAKWAMTLDGRIATRTGHSKWISNDESRAEVHRIRGRMDAIITGSGTVRADDPLLTARPPGPRKPARIVLDSSGTSVKADGNLIRSIRESPLIVCVHDEHFDQDHCSKLRDMGAEIFTASGTRSDQLNQLLDELGKRKHTHVLLEAGAGVMGAFFDAHLVDEVHVFVAAKIAGGSEAMSPVGGTGTETIPDMDSLTEVRTRTIGSNILIEGHVRQSD